MTKETPNTMTDILKNVTTQVTKEQEAVIERTLRNLVDLKTRKEKALEKAKEDVDAVHEQIKELAKMDVVEAYESIMEKGKAASTNTFTPGAYYQSDGVHVVYRSNA